MPLFTTMTWLFLTAPLGQVSRKPALLAKINSPREVLILSGIYQTLFNGAIKLGLLLLVWMVYRLAMLILIERMSA